MLEAGVLWIHSRELCGVSLRGTPSAAAALELLDAFEHYPCLAPAFDILIDAEGLELAPDVVEILLAWLDRHRSLGAHVRRRMLVLPRGVPGLVLAGIAPALGARAAVTLVPTVRAGLTAVLADDALADELAAIVSLSCDLAPTLRAVRRLLLAQRGAIDLSECARRLGMSTRSLQRQLGSSAASFRSEQAEARFAAVRALLCGDEKIASVAASVGLSEDGLSLLVRARAGMTPSSLRKQLRQQRECAQS